MKVVYGARCVWWDTIDKTGRTPPREGISIPCCPHCGGVLYEAGSEDEWWVAVDRHEAKKPEPGYRKLLEWMRGKCFTNYPAAQKAYAEAHRGQVP